MKATKSNRFTKWLVTAILIVIFCSLSGMIFFVAASLPKQVAAKFGPPVPYLSWRENLAYSVQLLLYEADLNTPSQQFNITQQFKIEIGEGIPSITQRLFNMGLINNVQAFEIYLIYSGLDRTIQAGSYSIDPGMTAVEIAKRLQDATPSEAIVTILAGWRIEEVAETLATSGLEIQPQDFIQFGHHPAGLDLSLPLDWQGLSLEGLLFPDQYIYQRDASLELFFDTVIDNFNQTVSKELEDAIRLQGLSLREGVILASIIEKEAIVTDEQPMIASVFYNRLQAGMLLESDPTAQYAIGYVGEQHTWWKNPLTLDDLAVDSQFNTYKYPGLPPGPICNPGISAIRAVAFPAQTEYFYFRAACDGSGRHSFAKTFEEHLMNACEH